MTQPFPTAWNPAVQLKENGELLDAFLTRYRAVKAQHKLPIWQVAEAAKWAPPYLGNATRVLGDGTGQKINVSTEFANRLAAVVDALEKAKTDDDVREVLHPGTTAAAASAVAVSMQRDESTDEDDGQNSTLEHALAILRRHGIISITLR